VTTRIFKSELREEVLAILRDPAALFFSVVMPVAFFAMSMGIFSGEGTALPMIATYGAFAAVFVVVLNPGIGLAESRDSGWLRIKRASGTPVSLTLIAKVVASVPYALAVLGAMVLTGTVFGGFGGEWTTVVRVAIALVLGALPFVFIGLAVGARAGANTTTAVLNALLFPMVIASGLWFPLEIMPSGIQAVAPWLPTYHLAGLATAQITGGPIAEHIAVLAVTGVLGAGAAALAYRSARV
jgi:ABC-2 type transport system permease protein